jgi:hypothetical protein
VVINEKEVTETPNEEGKNFKTCHRKDLAVAVVQAEGLFVG